MKIKMTNLYITLAIVFAGLQILFIFLSTRAGRKEALENTQKNLIENFKNLDNATKTELLLNADLNKDQMILLVNQQTKSSAIDIISTTANKFELVEEDLKLKNKKLEFIEKTTNTIVKIQKDNINMLNPSNLLINADLTIENGVKTPDFLHEIQKHNNDFKIWITLTQDDIEIFTYIDSMGKWEGDYSMEGTESNYGHPYMILGSIDKLKINKGNLIVQENNTNKMLRIDKEISFIIHYYKSSEDLYLNVLNFTFTNKNGLKIKPYNLKKESKIITSPILLDPVIGFYENTCILSGTFKIK